MDFLGLEAQLASEYAGKSYGGISTYFKPDDKLDYWVDQIAEYAPKKRR